MQCSFFLTLQDIKLEVAKGDSYDFYDEFFPKPTSRNVFKSQGKKKKSQTKSEQSCFRMCRKCMSESETKNV